MNKKGQIYLYLAFVGVVILALGFSLVYFKDQAVYGGLNIPFLDFLQPKTTIDTKDWKEFKAADDLAVLYPPSWLIVENKYIAQYPYTPGKASSDVYNAISVTPIVFQIQTSYANEDWVRGLYNAKDEQIVVNQYRPNDTNLGRYKKLESAKTQKGNSFVLFQDLKTPNQINAYLMMSTTKIYFFTLDHFDQAGEDFFKQIISTARQI